MRHIESLVAHKQMIVWIYSLSNYFFETSKPYRSLHYHNNLAHSLEEVQCNVFHQNLCGLNNKKEELEIYIHDKYQTSMHYLCISEHFLNEINIPLCHLENFKIASYNTRLKRKKGGTLILVAKDREFEETVITKNFYKAQCFEVCGVKDILTGIVVCCCYRIPLDKNFDMFLIKLEQLLEHLFNKKSVICGDFNVNLQCDDRKRNDLLNLLRCYNFRPLIISETTFIRNNSKSCIDNIFTNVDENQIKAVTIDHNGLGDGHAGLTCNLSATKQKPDKGLRTSPWYIVKRIFNEPNKKTFRNCLLNECWNDVGVNTFIKKLNSCFTKSFKKKKVLIKMNSTIGLRWLTRGLKVSSKMKRFLCMGKGNDSSVKSYTTRYIAIYRKTIKRAKSLGIQSEIAKSKNVTKTIWNVVNKHRNKTSRNSSSILLKVNDRIVDNATEIVDLFAKQFNVNNSANINSETAIECLLNHTKEISDEMILDPVTPDEITKIVKSMEYKNSCSFDEIPITVIRENIDILCVPLADFYNKCFEEGIFPDQLKIAKVVPVHKKGSKQDPKNFRPISVLPTTSKILEKLIKLRLTLHLNLNKILNPRQFGYRKNLGTLDAVNTLVNEVVKNLNEKKLVAGLFLDLSSAFDFVDHGILLRKLNCYGIRGKALELMTSYLSNRRMIVEVKTCNEVSHCKETSCSKLVDVKAGVPQGSILGPMLFNIFLNDLFNYMSENFPDFVSLVVFADDTNALVTANNINQFEVRINEVLTALSNWFITNGLKVNINKTSLMLFQATYRCKPNLNFSLKGDQIQLVEDAKFLGVHIDSHLNWKCEIADIEAKVSSACYVLRSLRDEVDLEHLKMVYYALIESRFRYSVLLWGNSYQYNMSKAFIMQKRAIRTMVRIKQQDSCRDHFKALEILTLPSLYILVLLCFFAKNLHLYETDDERCKREITRRKDFIAKISPKLNLAKHCSYFQSTKLFNRLPLELKVLIYSSSFKVKLKSFLLERCLYSIEEL